MKLTNNSFSPLLPSSYLDDPDQLISVHPRELEFLLKLNKPISSSFQLSNKSDQHLAFRVRTTNLKKYAVRPNKGIVLPRSQTNVTVKMQALKEEPSILQCNDKFLVQSVAVPPGTTPKDITPEMFNKEAGNHVEECKLSVDYDIPTKSEESEEETSEIAHAVPRGSSDHQIASTKSISYPDELDQLISVHPRELEFILKLNKPISSSFQLSNKSDQHLAFRVRTTNLKKYAVRPNKGIVLPRSQTNVTVTMQALKKEPSILQCNDKFLVQSVEVPPGTTPKDITPEMFNKEAGNHVEECKLSVDYDIPTKSEESEEETSEIAHAVPRGSSDHQIASTKTNDLISTHTKEKQANDLISTHAKENLYQRLLIKEQPIIQENNRLLKILKLPKHLPSWLKLPFKILTKPQQRTKHLPSWLKSCS